MRKRARLAVDLAAVLLLATQLLATLAILSHDSADPPDATVYPQHETPANLLGATGAAAARGLFDLFGIAVYPFLAAWMVLALALLLEGRRGVWSWRLLGWSLLVPALALAADYTDAKLLGGPLVSSGGLFGAALHDALAAKLTTTGMIFVIVATLVSSLGLALDFCWPHFFRWLGRFLYNALRPPVAHQADGEDGSPPAAAGSVAADESNEPLIPIRHPGDEEPPEAAGASESKAAENGTAPLPSSRATAEPPPVKRPAAMPRDVPRNAYELPPFDLLDDPEPFPYEAHDQHLRDRAVKLERTFTDFGLNVKVVGINTGPVITQYEVALETGLRVHKVTRLADDLALNLKVSSVRMVAPIPGKDTVGIEIPNEHRAVVRLKEVIVNAGPQLAKSKVPLFLGKDTEGRPLIYDLADMPHLLIAGRTGTGKSVCMNAIILSILMTRRPDEVRMIMIDPKMLELSEYGKIPHLMHPVVKDMKKAEAILAWAVDKMEERYDILSRARVRSIASYNELSFQEIFRRVGPTDEDERKRLRERMPYIVIFVDEMNDLMMTMRKEVEGHIIRLAQKSRAAGIHLVVATQKPTVDVITGLIKSNLPARICFQVSSRTDSRVVLDEMGADKLLGKGDMLFLQPGTSTIIRAQGTYASDREISRVVEHLECEPDYAAELIQLSTKPGPGGGGPAQNRDELYEPAVEIVIREGRGSVSLLQRALGIGYGRAARLIDFMAEDGIVGPYNGSNAREVLVAPEQWELMRESREPVDSP
jgi:S-DNA-T family DNA segregation ATPase FtsK/SpoIIIE